MLIENSLAQTIASKKAIIDVKNNDDKCLEWYLKTALYPANTNANNKYSYTKYDSPNLELKVVYTFLHLFHKFQKKRNISMWQ